MTEPTQTATSACEHHEADLSALLDGETATVDLLPTLDHVVDCPSCAQFYRRGRDLDLAVRASQSGSQEAGVEDRAIEPSDAVWQRIADEAPWAETAPQEENASEPVVSLASRRRRRGRVMEWAPRLAAAFVVACGLWIVYAATRDAGTTQFFRQASEASVEASVEASADVLSADELSESRIDPLDLSVPDAETAEMNEERFVRLATEVLRADPRFQHEMLRVMKTATRGEGREAAADVGAGEDGRDAAESGGAYRNSAGDRAWK